MGTPYTSQSISGYNVSPPSDDGAVTPQNQVHWSTFKSKLGDPVKTLAEAIDSALVNQFDIGPDAKTSDYSVLSTDYGKIISVDGSWTVTLPDASTTGAGFMVIVVNEGSGTPTVDLATGTDTLNGVAGSSTTLPGRLALQFLVNSAATGYIIIGSSETPLRDGQAPMTGALDLNGNDLILDVDADSKIVTSVDDEVRIDVGGVASLATLTTSGLEVQGTVTATGALSPSTGIYLGGTGSENLLDDYEEGDWTPDIRQAGAAISDAAYNGSFTSGQYTKVGRLVSASASLRLTDKGTVTSSNAFQIGGLPFVSTNNVKARAAASVYNHSGGVIDTSGNKNGTLTGLLTHNADEITFAVIDPSDGSSEAVQYADVPDDLYIQISLAYITG